jgi:thioesterase domain-containing protein
MTEFGQWLSGVVPESTGRERHMAAGFRADLRAEKRQEREEEARRQEAAARAERTALAARQLGVDLGDLTRAATRLGDAQAEVTRLAEELAKAEAKRDSARRGVEHINDLLGQAHRIAAGDTGPAGELPTSRHARQVLAEVQRSGASWWEAG